MPIVLTTAEGRPQAGYVYDDQTGVSYEYPRVYDNLITPGVQFVYHRPRIGYTGSGVIGDIMDSAIEGRRVCEILDYEEFAVFVPLKDPSGAYYEADPEHWPTGNVYWAKGVRPLGNTRFEAILSAANIQRTTPTATGSYPTSATAREVDEYAMTVALTEAAHRFPQFSVAQMPQNNPGYDIRIGDATHPHWYIEVKGTSTGDPVFFLSEGERLFSEHNSSNYTLLVVVGINPRESTHSEVRIRDGAVTLHNSALEVRQWRGRLLED